MGFAAKATLQEHTRACQNQSGKESQHECPECGNIFSREGQLRLHLKAHTGKKLLLFYLNMKSVKIHCKLKTSSVLCSGNMKYTGLLFLIKI
jgi:uncharacterized Zn-finger protein